MDIKINGIGFQGKKEVLYGLKKSAQKAKNIEYYSQPSIVSRMSGSMLTYTTTEKAAMRAYLDMTLRDEAFPKTVKEMKASDFYVLQELLRSELTEHSYVKPFNKFKEVINETLNSIGGPKKAAIKESIEKLLKEFEL